MVAVLALAAGLLIGNRSAYGRKTLKTQFGEIVMLNSQGDVTFETGNAEDQKAFEADAVWWEGEQCVRRQGDRSPAEVGWVDIRRPGGGGVDDQVLWVSCA